MPNPDVKFDTWKMPENSFMFAIAVDVATTVITCIFIFQQIPSLLNSVETTRSIVDGITSIDWGAEEESLFDKKQRFFLKIEEVVNLIASENAKKTTANLYTFASL
ncbi:hypothetical protein T484DRAFT_1899712 [Baffinella frigidus]|nr:hypothetical protein T484DRAFT_1899712 [Cryptophyta sp. CCMP2293]